MGTHVGTKKPAVEISDSSTVRAIGRLMKPSLFDGSELGTLLQDVR